LQRLPARRLRTRRCRCARSRKAVEASKTKALAASLVGRAAVRAGERFKTMRQGVLQRLLLRQHQQQRKQQVKCEAPSAHPDSGSQRWTAGRG
jgi:hypothetical protein